MAHYRLSKYADNELSKIYEHGILTFGLSEAQTYLYGLHDRFNLLAENPSIGRSAVQLAPKLKRFEYRAHVIFYIPEDTGVFIVRVLGNAMDFKRHI